MSHNVKRRLAALERAVGARQGRLTDAELAEVLSRRSLEAAHVRALCRRIERYFAASMVSHAVGMKRTWLTGYHEGPVGVLGIVAAHLAWETGTSPPPDFVAFPDLSLEMLPPLRRSQEQPGEMEWQHHLRDMLAKNLIRSYGRDALRDKVATYVQSEDPNAYLEVVPYLDSTERDALLAVVDSIETTHTWHDLPLLVWYDDRGLYSSHKPQDWYTPPDWYMGEDKAGQKWTALWRSGSNEEE